MNVVDLYPSYYGLYIEDRNQSERIFLNKDISPNSNRSRIDLFESEAVANEWLKNELKRMKQAGWWGSYSLFSRLYPKKLTIKEVSKLMKEKREIDSVSILNRNKIRRLYFRQDLGSDYDLFLKPQPKIHAKEPIYIINRQKEIDDKTVLQKDSYFIVYPLIATPLFTYNIIEWAEDLMSRKPNQVYYIEETSLYDLYMKTKLMKEDAGFFILSKEQAPHYILGEDDLKRIVEGSFN